MLKIKTISHLSKVFPDKSFDTPVSFVEGARNQELAFQVLLNGNGEVEVEINSPIKVTPYRVGYVPSNKPCYENSYDDNYLTLTPGLFPDPLLPLDGGKITLNEGENQALWICIDAGACAGEHTVSLAFKQEGEVVGECSVLAKIHDIELPESTLLFTQWFHCDCIASVHEVEQLSEEHWSLIEKYLKLATQHGMNIVLTPVLTPPLDTDVGEERPTVQLVDITLENGKYSFDFSRLARFARIARECGIKYLEINHFFTQWGAAHAPKVIATVDGEEKRIFGWETDALGQEYKSFLSCLIPQIIDTLEGVGYDRSHLIFHISDEPGAEHIEAYSSGSEVIAPLTKGCIQIDALSNLDFYKKGLVRTPVVGINDIEPFIEAGVSPLWGYYCCAQTKEVSNRFFDMPSARTRIIGTQLYKYNLAGFLHWGYNFYYTRLSKRQRLNPYEETDAYWGFPSGDAFSVYPLGDGATPSLRLKVFSYALDDIRLLRAVEEKIGVLDTHKLLFELADMDMTFKVYPRDNEFFERLYARAFEILEDK